MISSHEFGHELPRAPTGSALFRVPAALHHALGTGHAQGSVATTDQKVRGSSPFGRAYTNYTRTASHQWIL